MNTPSPLVPQGTTPPRGKSSLYFKVLMIVSVHVVLIGGMLLQGCKDTKPASDASKTDDSSSLTNTTASTDASNLPPVNTAGATAPASAPYATATVPAAPANPAYATPTPMTAPAAGLGAPIGSTVTPSGEGREYVIVAGDRLSSIAKKNGVSLKALMAANPGVDPKKLKIGAKLQLPDGSAVAATPAMATAAGAPMAESGDSASYTVKSGDMLGKIAKAHGTTVKKIMAMNDLKSTQIRVGQTLKLPSAGSSAPAMPGPAPAPGVMPATPSGPAGASALSPTPVLSASAAPVARASGMAN